MSAIQQIIKIPQILVGIVLSFVESIFSFPGRVVNYIKLVWGELEKVDWLNGEQVVNGTFTVIAMTLFIGLFVLLSDTLMVEIRNFIFTLR